MSIRWCSDVNTRSGCSLACSAIHCCFVYVLVELSVSSSVSHQWFCTGDAPLSSSGSRWPRFPAFSGTIRALRLPAPALPSAYCFLLIHEAQQGCRDATYEPWRFPVAVPYPSPHRATPAYVVVTSSDLDTSRNKASVSGLSWISRYCFHQPAPQASAGVRVRRDAPAAMQTWQRARVWIVHAGRPFSSVLAYGQEQDLPGSLAIHPVILRRSTTPDDPLRLANSGASGTAHTHLTMKASSFVISRLRDASSPAVYASRRPLPHAMQDSLPAGGLRLCRAGVEPAESLREVSAHVIPLSRAYPVASWSHARRGFEVAQGAEPRLAGEALALIGALYRDEKRIREKGLCGTEKLACSATIARRLRRLSLSGRTGAASGRLTADGSPADPRSILLSSRARVESEQRRRLPAQACPPPFQLGSIRKS